jgi:hypothetical protein
MAISNYTELKEQVITWSHRDDIDQLVDNFIDLVEVEMFNNPNEVLRVRGQETRSTATTSGKYLALPDDYQSIRNLRFDVTGEVYELDYQTPDLLNRYPSTGRPQSFTVTSQIEFNRVPDQNYTIEMQYYALPTGISSASPTNEILTKFPTIYLFGCLWAVFNYATDQAESQKYYTQFINAIKGANKKDKQGRYGPAPSVTIAGSTP